MNPYVMLKKVNDNNLTIEEFYCGYLIHLSKEKLNDVNEEFGKYFKTHVNDINFLKAVDKLEERGFIKNGNVGNVYRFENIQITDEFLELIVVKKDDAWDEVLKMYPVQGYVNGKKVFLQAHDEKLKTYYYNKILKGGDLGQHEKFIAILDYYFQDRVEDNRKSVKVLRENETCMSLKNFIYSWDSIVRMILSEINADD